MITFNDCPLVLSCRVTGTCSLRTCFRRASSRCRPPTCPRRRPLSPHPTAGI